nr:tripartite tricarboxylate transporter permease [Acidaminococcus intestini]
MDAFTQFGQALLSVCQPVSLLFMLAGVIIGIIFGSIPGLSAAMAVALILPLTFSMKAVLGMNMLVAVYIGGISGGLISAILLNMPGTASSIATCFDGHPMAMNGKAGKALHYGIVFSFVGSVFSFIILTFFAPKLAAIALKFTPAENFGICFFALVMVAVLSSGDLLRGLLSGFFGLMFTMVGLAPIDGTIRFTFGNVNMMAGFDTLSTLIGIFAISEILITSEQKDKGEQVQLIQMEEEGHGILGRILGLSWAEFKYQIPNAFRSALIGLGIGILPGIGGSTSGMLSYVMAKKASKYPEKVGTGCPDGVVATETANNATIGGALIPLLVLGIPGDGVTAMMLGGFLIHGLSAGPLLFVKNADVVYGIFAACVVCITIMLIVESLGIRFFVKLLKIPKYILMPCILVLCCVGAYAANSRVFDVQSTLLFGVIGYLYHKLGLKTTPFVLCFLVGGMVETYLRRGIMQYKSFMAFFNRPIFDTFFFIAVAILLWSIYKESRGERKVDEE